MRVTTGAALHPRLAAMFCFQSMIMGAQAMLLTGHMDALGFSGSQIGWVRATSALAAVVSPLAIGALADRRFPAHILLGLSSGGRRRSSACWRWYQQRRWPGAASQMEF